ncbi:hypothetical protein JANAI62_36990 [Jannaschia pagri]|uniref:Bile acid:Na+ symporter, BASS family n=1 Tax=Jannaschia pagri TaxID=2829797 RepID=A0ABQ4NRQ5_9RHOB|nr:MULTISPECIES: bile acid:sodium symporter [unclassified Jannaschia]GIT93257.1 hypothetical protein JANAI61_37150 [Jannaschia sp. AI_61]GIT97076.1 hypothetical protein JANAI62_36990 [Jannaschia sp. AI_62]
MDVFVATLLPLAVVVIMVSLGLDLTTADFRRIVTRPRAFFIGALNQVVLLPVVAYLIILAFGFTGETAVGLMILAACPGGAASNVVTKLADWDVALSVTLTATFSLTCIATLPVVLAFAMGQFMGEAVSDVNIAQAAFTAFLLTALPIGLGMTLRIAAPGAMAAIAPAFSKLAVVLFVAVILGAFASNWDVVTNNIGQVGFGLLTLLALLTAIGLAVSRMLGASDREAKTIAVETGVQNGALALAIAALLLPDGETFGAYAIPAALYGAVWIGATGAVFGSVALKRLLAR